MHKRGAIHVSFDIDDTLVCAASVPTEQHLPFWLRRRYPERVRRGFRSLALQLRRRGCHIWVYTTSRRPADYLAGWFRSMGVPLAGVVNQSRHEAVVGGRGPSKYPPAFGIGLHIDDSEGVAMEGSAHGFRVVLVAPEDERWDERILRAVDELQTRPA